MNFFDPKCIIFINTLIISTFVKKINSWATSYQHPYLYILPFVF